MSYDTDLSDQQWKIIQPMLPVNSGPGRPIEIDLRQVVNAIIYLVRTGCQWRNLPIGFPKWGSVYYYFRKWSKNGDWQTITQRSLKNLCPKSSCAIAVDNGNSKTI